MVSERQYLGVLVVCHIPSCCLHCCPLESWCSWVLAAEVVNCLLLTAAVVKLQPLDQAEKLALLDFLGCSSALEEVVAVVEFVQEVVASAEFGLHCLQHHHFFLNPVGNGRAPQCCQDLLELQVSMGQRCQS